MGMLNSVFPTFRFLPTYLWRRTSMMLKKSIVASGMTQTLSLSV
jgi:hypothetical protein